MSHHMIPSIGNLQKYIRSVETGCGLVVAGAEERGDGEELLNVSFILE